MSHHGTELAIAELNAQGGVLGKQLELLTEDNQSKQGEAKTCAQKLITRDNVIALLGEVASGRSLEAAPICQKYKIPMISPSSTNPKVTQTGNYIFRVCFIDPFQGKVMAKFALGSLKLKNVAVLTDVGLPYSVGLAEFFRPAFVEGGGKIVEEKNYSSGMTDFRAQLTAIKAANPDGIFVPGYYTEAGLICRQAKELGLNVPIFGGDGWESAKLVEIGGTGGGRNVFLDAFFGPAEIAGGAGFREEIQGEIWSGARCDGGAGIRFGNAAGRCHQAGGNDRRAEAARHAGRDEGLSRNHGENHD